ncbi:hypothetical protein KFK09_011487 [Dendrobium nobile]|uniref:Uncharacterized protein n=1 Tax=Dendrobium nobile TaxID=94219 RepID=A0A8T3BF48_DENNO|nr:hypothetical protein KFK09_011487 [Dendrobium nobile]
MAKLVFINPSQFLELVCEETRHNQLKKKNLKICYKENYLKQTLTLHNLAQNNINTLYVKQPLRVLNVSMHE